jgi:[acyl-carrier-protein] S-malonyltransferase
LNATAVSQPGILLTSAACLQALRSGLLEGELAEVEPDACVGLSLGEYTALYAAGALGLAEALRLVQVRGEAMEEAAKLRAGGMVSVLGLGEERVAALCEAVLAERPVEEDGEAAVLAPVNFNCPGQIVVSGTKGAVGLAAAKAEGFGASRAIELVVAGGFHTELMRPAAERLGVALAGVEFAEPECPVYANVDVEAYGSAAEIPAKLMAQLTGAVRWQQTVERLLGEGFERFVEIGPGRVLTGLVKKTARERKARPEIVTING